MAHTVVAWENKQGRAGQNEAPHLTDLFWMTALAKREGKAEAMCFPPGDLS